MIPPFPIAFPVLLSVFSTTVGEKLTLCSLAPFSCMSSECISSVLYPLLLGEYGIELLDERLLLVDARKSTTDSRKKDINRVFID